MTKQEIRSAMRLQRSQYPHGHRDSLKIYEVLQHWPVYQNCTALFAYAAMSSEVETYLIIETALRQGKRVCLPRVESGRQMHFYEVKDVRSLKRSSMGIYEPAQEAPLAEPDEKTLFLLPGLAFDQKGGRLGFGAGYYDRYLAQYPQAQSAGLCFSFQVMAGELPQEETDIKVQYLIMPEGIKTISRREIV